MYAISVSALFLCDTIQSKAPKSSVRVSCQLGGSRRRQQTLLSSRTLNLQRQRAAKQLPASRSTEPSKRSLRPLTRRLDDSLQNHHDFKLLRLHGPLGELVEGAFGVNHMADRERRDEKELVCTGAEAHVQFQLIQRKKLAFGCLARLRKCTGRDKERECLVEEGRKEVIQDPTSF